MNQVLKKRIPNRMKSIRHSLKLDQNDIEVITAVLRIELFNRPAMIRMLEFIVALAHFLYSIAFKKSLKNYTLGHYQIGVITSLMWTKTKINRVNYIGRLVKLLSLRYSTRIFTIGYRIFKNSYYKKDRFIDEFATFYNGTQVSVSGSLKYSEVLEFLLKNSNLERGELDKNISTNISTRISSSNVLNRFKKIRSDIIQDEELRLSIIICDKHLEQTVYRGFFGGSDSIIPVLNQRRSVASTIKIAIYSCYIELFNPDLNKIFEDKPISVVLNNETVIPRNSDNKYRGDVTLEYAFAYSINTIAIQLLMEIGIENFVDYLRKCGITVPLPNTPIIALGAFKLNGYELLSLFSPILHNGFLKLFGNDRNRDSLSYRILSENTIQKMNILLKSTVRYGTANYLNEYGFGQQGGKTGTSEKNRDFWYIGYFNDQYYGLVWIGSNNEKELKSKDDISLSATRIAVPIWKDLSMIFLE
tara:strand:+ start:117 stop:1535 length:1419 start_codon:yes stop_codon:yes gene_type:complete